MGQKNNDLKKIKEIVEIMKDKDLVEVDIKHGDDRILLKRAQSEAKMTPYPAMPAGMPAAAAPATQPAQKQAGEQKQQEAAKDEDLEEITSPIVGTFYAAPSPDSDPYVTTGSKVNPSTVVCIVEAMKVMNEIKAETSGEIAEICVKNGEPVEFGQVLYKVKP